MNYIHRDIEEKIQALSREYACLLLTGPRQVGKSTVLEHLMTDDRTKVTLDDLSERALAKRDPAMFLQLHGRRFLLADRLQNVSFDGTGTGIAGRPFWKNPELSFTCAPTPTTCFKEPSKNRNCIFLTRVLWPICCVILHQKS